MECMKIHQILYFLLVFFDEIKNVVGKPDPLVSQSGMVPMQTSTPASFPVEEPPEKLSTVPLANRQGSSTDQEDELERFNILLSSFPTEGPSSDANPESIIPPADATMSQPFLLAQPQPLSSFSIGEASPYSFYPSGSKIIAPIVVYEDERSKSDAVAPGVDNGATNPKELPVGRNMDSSLSNILKADAIEKDIFAESEKEDISRQVLGQPTEPSSLPSMDNTLNQRQTGKINQTRKDVHSDTDENESKKVPLFQQPNDILGDGRGEIPFYKPGPPWEDEKITGKIVEEMPFPPMEISHKVATKLCTTRKRFADSPEISGKPKYYLWAPINQYVPLIHKGFPIRPPVFAPECCKWVLHQCRGEVRRPMLKPCTYWAPMPIRRPECGFLPNIQTKIVNYRPVNFAPGNCPCVWPCTRRFDPIQRCRVETTNAERHIDAIHSDGDPWHEGELKIQDNLADQLCRGMKLALTMKHTIPIGWIPIRIDSIDKSAGQSLISKPSSTPEEKDNVLQFRKKREITLESARESKRKRVTELKDHSIKRMHQLDKQKKKRHSKRLAIKKFYNPDAVSETNTETGGLGGRTDKVLDKEEEEESESSLVSLLGSYDPQQYLLKANDSSGDNIPRCVVWKYKACPKGKSSEEVHERKFVSSDAHESRRGRSSLQRRSSKVKRVRRTKRSGFHNRHNKMIEIEGSGRINKRHEDKDPKSEFFNVLDAQGDVPGAGCGQWHFTETNQCIPDETVEAASKRLSKVMITGTIDSDETVEEDEDDDLKVVEGVPKGETKTVRDLCPGSPWKFPCFLRRRKRDANEIETTADNDDKDNASNNTITPAQVENNFSSNSESEESESRPGITKTEAKPGDSDDQKIQTSSSLFRSQIQIPPDPGCMCDWPCLPFFDKINRCYNGYGGVIDSKGKPISRSFRRYQRDPVVCLNFIETDAIYCKIKVKIGI